MNGPWDVFLRTCVCSKWKMVTAGGEEARPRVLSGALDGSVGDVQVSDGRTLMQQPFAVHHQNNSSQFERRQCLFQYFAGFTPPLSHACTHTHTMHLLCRNHLHTCTSTSSAAHTSQWMMMWLLSFLLFSFTSDSWLVGA